MIKIIFNLFIALILVNNILYSENKIERGEESFNLNKYKEAIVLYQSIISNKEQKYIDKFGSIKELEAFCYFRIGKCYYYQGLFATALKTYNKIINDYDNTTYNSKALFWKGSSYYNIKKDYDAAMECFFEYYKKFKKNSLFPISIFCIVNCYRKLNKVKEAIDFLEKTKKFENIDNKTLKHIEFELKTLKLKLYNKDGSYK